MKRLLAIVIALCPASAAMGWPSFFAPQTPQTPHPAVVRVVAQDHNGYSLGSGALVAVTDNHGLVVTNWHVVRDAVGPITILFPDGFRSGAAVLKVDRDWDLAALAIGRPNAQPILLSTEPPRPGEVLTIAGYGSGSYRAVSGRCTEYLSPGGHLPYEMVELDAGARQGDSGGPILNSRGELAGVLFGTAFGRTTGSYCCRVREFLASASGDFRRLPGSPALVAQSPLPYQPPPATAIAVAPAPLVAARTDPVPQSSYGAAASPWPPLRSGPQTADPTAGQSYPGVSIPVQSPKQSTPLSPSPPPTVGSPISQLPGAIEPSMPTRAEQIKTILAVIGLISILFHSIRLVGAAAG